MSISVREISLFPELASLTSLNKIISANGQITSFQTSIPDTLVQFSFVTSRVDNKAFAVPISTEITVLEKPQNVYEQHVIKSSELRNRYHNRVPKFFKFRFPRRSSMIFNWIDSQ